MSRTTIDFGIDLGTTNSAIASLRGTVTDIVKNNLDTDITPSAVHINAKGRVQVGAKARDRLLDERSGGDAYVEFKRRMGTDHVYRFASAGASKTPEELSAEVLKNLRGDVQQRLDEDIRAAVITVPAAFEQRQCAATKRAGELAGLVQCPLVQEPVAAALAYGFQSDAQNEYWLVYDFGGGTFDAALLRANDGMIDVVNHGGDNYLGGADIDWAIVDQIVLPQIANEYSFPDFHRKNDRWKIAFACIKRAVEVARIELSRSETAFLEDCNIKDADGNDVEVELSLTRGQVVNIAEPLIMRSVDICQRVLSQKGLSKDDIAKAPLVGGPTLAPYFRDILEDQLGIPLDYSIDPLTVVARGAAVFAGTQQLAADTLPQVEAGTLRLDLKYSPVGADPDPTVRGKILSEDGANFEGYTIQFLNQQSKWESGKIPVKSTGSFRSNLLAEPGDKNEFRIELYDGTGKLLKTSPERIDYTIGVSISNQPVINSLGVALANNDFDVFFKKGNPLPARATKIYRTAHALDRGQSGELLKIPVVEGENERADRNRLQDSLTVEGTNMRRDLPQGSEVEVTLVMDESRTIHAKAYIPMLDEEFEAVIDPESHTPDTDRLKQELTDERQRLNDLRGKGLGEESLAGHSSRFDEIDDLVATAEADSDAANKAEARLLELKVELDKAEDASEWPRRVEEANAALSGLDDVIEQFGEESHRQRAKTFREEVEEIIENKRDDRLPKKIEQVNSYAQEVLASRDEFWVFLFQQLQEQRGQMRDQAMAERIIQQGNSCVQRGDAQALQQVVIQLLGLLPQDVAAQVQQGFGSGLTK